jgi:sugar phosphate isomerase/epimerase
MLYGGMNSPVKPVLKQLETIAELGFDYLELTMDAPQTHHSMIRQQKNEILRTLNRFKMQLVCHLPTFVSTADLTESLRKASLNEVLQSLEVATDLQPLKVVLHPSQFVGLSLAVMDQAEKHAWMSLEAIVERADQLGLCLCIENMFPSTHSLVEPEDFYPVFERFPSLRMTLDIAHAHIQSKGCRRTLDLIDRFGDRIEHVHASDNFGREDIHLPIGAGTLEFPKILKALKERGYDKTLTLEVFSKDIDYLKISKEKLIKLLTDL